MEFLGGIAASSADGNVVRSEARYFGGRVEERSLVPLGEARRGRIGLEPLTGKLSLRPPIEGAHLGWQFDIRTGLRHS